MRSDLIREGKMFIKNEIKVACRVSVIEWRVVYFAKLLFETSNEKFSLRRVKSKKICRHPALCIPEISNLPFLVWWSIIPVVLSLALQVTFCGKTLNILKEVFINDLLYVMSWVPSVLWYCWLGLLTCKNCLPYNLYCVGGDLKHCSVQSNPICPHVFMMFVASIEMFSHHRGLSEKKRNRNRGSLHV